MEHVLPLLMLLKSPFEGLCSEECEFNNSFRLPNPGLVSLVSCAQQIAQPPASLQVARDEQCCAKASCKSVVDA